jgi:hypothetical protein
MNLEIYTVYVYIVAKQKGGIIVFTYCKLLWETSVVAESLTLRLHIREVPVQISARGPAILTETFRP